jgi:hypothetical protein
MRYLLRYGLPLMLMACNNKQPKPAARAVTETAGAEVHTAGTPHTPNCLPSPMVDFHNQSVAGLRLDTTVTALRRLLGDSNVAGQPIDTEGGPDTAYTLRICGHFIELFPGQARWTDSAFHSRERVAVGSRLGALDSAFGPGRVSADQGLSVGYQLPRGRLYAEVDQPCYTPGEPTWAVDRTCRVVAMNWVLGRQ